MSWVRELFLMNLEILKTPKMGFLVRSEFLKKKFLVMIFFLIFVFCVSIELLKYENTIIIVDDANPANNFSEWFLFLNYGKTLMSNESWLFLFIWLSSYLSKYQMKEWIHAAISQNEMSFAKVHFCAAAFTYDAM